MCLLSIFIDITDDGAFLIRSCSSGSCAVAELSEFHGGFVSLSAVQWQSYRLIIALDIHSHWGRWTKSSGVSVFATAHLCLTTENPFCPTLKKDKLRSINTPKVLIPHRLFPLRPGPSTAICLVSVCWPTCHLPLISRSRLAGKV